MSKQDDRQRMQRFKIFLLQQKEYFNVKRDKIASEMTSTSPPLQLLDLKIVSLTCTMIDDQRIFRMQFSIRITGKPKIEKAV